LISLVFIFDVISQGWEIEVCTTIITDLLDVIPNIARSEMHIALIACVIVWAYDLLQKFTEVIQVDPAWLIATTFTVWARHVTNVFMALAIFSFADRQISFAYAM
jgi:hypothetical protein